MDDIHYSFNIYYCLTSLHFTDSTDQSTGSDYAFPRQDTLDGSNTTSYVRDASGKSIFSLMRASASSNNNSNRIDTSPLRTQTSLSNAHTPKRTKSLTTDSIATMFNITTGAAIRGEGDPSQPQYRSSPNSPVGLRHHHLTFDDTTTIIDLSVQKQPLRRSRGIFGSAKSRSNSTSSKVPISLFGNAMGSGIESLESGGGETSNHSTLPLSETADGTEGNLQRRGSAISLGHTMRCVIFYNYFLIS